MLEVCVFYDVANHEFLDGEGEVIGNIFDLITPSDLFLFRSHPELNVFRMSKTKHICLDDIYVRIEAIPEKDICRMGDSRCHQMSLS